MPALTGKGRVFSYMMFFYMLAAGLISPVFAEYLKEITGSESYVGVLFSLAYFITFVISILISKILYKVSRLILLYIGFFGMAITYLLFSLIDSAGFLIGVQVLKGFFIAVLFVVIPLMIRDYTDDDKLSREEGRYYWFINLAWILGPITGGVISYYLGIRSVFLFSMLILLFSVWFLRHEHIVSICRRKNDETRDLVKNLKRFFNKTTFLQAYLVDLGVHLWYIVSVMAIPLYMISSGFSVMAVGLVMALKVMPLILFEKFIADHAKGEGIGLSIRNGFIVMVIALIAIAVVNDVYFSIGMFLIVSLGVAFIEPIKETYLFRHMSREQEDDLYPIYATARQVAFMIGPVSAGFTITYFGYQVLFLLLGFSLIPMVLVGYLISKE
ncbi:MAG: MFS transporter [Patescibacteria group bacterium]|nr:MFS transporter [Patescibacteria group bacterium]